MTVLTKIFPAIDVIGWANVEGGFAGVPHWKIRFKARTKRMLPEQIDPTDFVGCGVYGVVWKVGEAPDGSLGYIGSYMGGKRPKGADFVSFSGDVRERHWKHLATQSGRGPMFLNRSVLAVLTEEFGSDHPMIRQVRAGTNEVFSAKSKPLGAYGRLAFAAKNWDFFSTARPDQILSSATLVYTRLTRLPQGMTAQDAFRRIQVVETALIGRLQPQCNSTHRDYNVAPTSLTAHEVAALFQTEFEHQFDLVQS